MAKKIAIGLIIYAAFWSAFFGLVHLTENPIIWVSVIAKVTLGIGLLAIIAILSFAAWVEIKSRT